MAFVSDSARAQSAFNTAIEQAKYTTRDIFNSFGLTRQDPSTGAWTTSSSSSAFDPSKLLSYNADTGAVSTNQAQIDALGRGEFGTAMGYNRMSNVIGQAGTREALAKANLRSRGLGRGGLMSQAASAAESSQMQEQAGVGAELLAALGQTYGSVGGAVSDFYSGVIEGAGAGGQQVSAASAASSVNAPVAPTAGKPTTPGSKMYELKNGYRWMGKKGWVPVK